MHVSEERQGLSRQYARIGIRGACINCAKRVKGQVTGEWSLEWPLARAHQDALRNRDDAADAMSAIDLSDALPRSPCVTGKLPEPGGDGLEYGCGSHCHVTLGLKLMSNISHHR